MIRSRLFVLHPFLFTLFPILSLYVNNLSQEPFAAVARSLAVGLAGAGLLLNMGWLIFRDWHRAGLAVTLGALLFFSFGSFSQLLKKQGSQSGWLALLFFGLLVAGEIWIARRGRGFPRSATRVLNIAGSFALATCLYGFATFGVRSIEFNQAQRATAAPVKTNTPVLKNFLAGSPVLQEPVPLPVTGAKHPDIYYIILDGHGRSDVLSEIYGVNNQHFISFLRSRGFTVAASSHTNYDQTALSLASSLNFSYIDQKLTPVPVSDDRAPLTRLINDSDVTRFLHDQGYYTVAFENGFPDTEMTTADQFIRDPKAMNGFELSLLSQSLGGQQLHQDMVENYRQRILRQESQVENLVAQPGPKFVFAHFILPHPPFVFRADSAMPITLDSADGSQYTGTRADYHDGYRDQVQFADALAEKMIAFILDHSTRPPVIILQGDHGPGMYLDWDSQASTCLRERFSILNAYYLPTRYNLPGQNAAQMLSPGITPVNSFRVVFDAYFGADLPLLPDRSFYSTWARPYDFSEITGKWEKTCKDSNLN